MKEQKITTGTKIFCDMDGVLVNFEDYVIGLLNNLLDGGKLPGTKRSKSYYIKLTNLQKEMGNGWRASSGKDLQIKHVRNFMFSVIGQNPGHVYANMNSYPDAIEKLWPFLNSTGRQVSLLSAPIRARDSAPMTSEEGKTIWAKRLDPQPASIIIKPAKRKHEHAVVDGISNVLIDDKKETIDSWIKSGGIGILHEQGNSIKTIRALISAGI